MRRSANDQIGMDLAEHASRKASDAMLQALSLCDTPEQAVTVALKVLGTIAAQAAGAVIKYEGKDVSDFSSADLLQVMTEIMRTEETRHD